MTRQRNANWKGLKGRYPVSTVAEDAMMGTGFIDVHEQAAHTRTMGMRVEIFGLNGKPLRSTNIVSVHSRDIVRGAIRKPFIQSGNDPSELLMKDPDAGVFARVFVKN